MDEMEVVDEEWKGEEVVEVDEVMEDEGEQER